MISKRISLFILLTLTISLSFQQELKFPFYIEDRPQRPSSNLISFKELPEAPVVSSEDKRACIDMCFGNKPQCFKMEIQTGSFYMWVAELNSDLRVDNKFDSSKSKSIERNRTELLLEYQDDKNIVGYTAKDDLYIGGSEEQNKVFRGNFVLATRSDSFSQTEGMIGLGYTPSSYEEKYSLIEQLYEQKIIFHKVFTQSFTTSKKGELTFGKIPDKIVNDYKNYGRCQALDKIQNGERYKNRSWQCQLTGVFYGDVYSPSKVKAFSDTQVSFFSYRKRALVPIDFFEYLEATYFKDYIARGICERVVKKRYDTFSCKQDIIDAPEVVLVFGDWGMKIPSDVLFVHKSDKKTGDEWYEFLFYHKNNFENYSLGRPVVRNYHMVYDFQNEQIGFYSKDNVIYTGTSQPEPPTLHEFLPDKQSSKPTFNPSQTKRPVTKPENILKPITHPTNPRKPRKPSRTVSSAFIVQLLLLIFVILVAVALLGFGAYMYIRYRRKTKFPGADYYMKQSEELVGTTINA